MSYETKAVDLKSIEGSFSDLLPNQSDPVMLAFSIGVSTIIEKLNYAKAHAEEDLSQSREELDRLMAFGDVRDLSDEDLDQACRLESDLSFQAQSVRLVEKYREQLFALALHRQKVEPVSSDQLLSGQSVAQMLRVLVYRLWAQSDETQLRGGRAPLLPFTFEVGDRVKRSKDGEEFYSLLHFLPQYHQATGRVLVPIAKSETPDFVCKDLADGADVGVEIAEAVHDKVNENRVSAARWERILSIEVSNNRNCYLFFPEKVPFPKRLIKDKDQFVKFVENSIAEFHDNGKNEFDYPNSESAICSFSIGHSEGNMSFMYSSGRMGWTGDSPERHVANALRQRITEKVTKTRPRIDTILVLYPNDLVPAANYEIAAQYAAQGIPNLSQSMFSEIWLSKEVGGWPIAKRVGN